MGCSPVHIPWVSAASTTGQHYGLPRRQSRSHPDLWCFLSTRLVPLSDNLSAGGRRPPRPNDNPKPMPDYLGYSRAEKALKRSSPKSSSLRPNQVSRRLVHLHSIKDPPAVQAIATHMPRKLVLKRWWPQTLRLCLAALLVNAGCLSYRTPVTSLTDKPDSSRVRRISPAGYLKEGQRSPRLNSNVSR
jgi:hypothetical protein